MGKLLYESDGLGLRGERSGGPARFSGLLQCRTKKIAHKGVDRRIKEFSWLKKITWVIHGKGSRRDRGSTSFFPCDGTEILAGD